MEGPAEEDMEEVAVQEGNGSDDEARDLERSFRAGGAAVMASSRTRSAVGQLVSFSLSDSLGVHR